MSGISLQAELDEDDALIALVESEDFVPVSRMTPERAAEFRAAAGRAMNEPRVKISLRVTESDLIRLKARAMREGVPYQTLINAILHQAVAR